MKSIQKLVLVPIEKWEKIGGNIPVKEVSVTTVAQKNVSHQENPVSPITKVKLKVKNQQGLGKQELMKQTQMFHFLTQEKRKKAVKLFEFLKNNNFFSLNHDGEIIRNGKVIHDSNILELVSHAVQNVSSNPIGMKYFYKTLMKKNIPEIYISNKIGRKIMNKSLLNETSRWRPPGRLSNKTHVNKK